MKTIILEPDEKIEVIQKKSDPVKELNQEKFKIISEFLQERRLFLDARSPQDLQDCDVIYRYPDGSRVLAFGLNDARCSTKMGNTAWISNC